MKTVFSLLLIVCSVPFSLGCKEDSSARSHQRLYVQLSDVKIAQDGIYARLGDAWIPVKAVARNQKGTYVVGSFLKKDLTECRNRSCGRVYYTNRHPSKCPYCGCSNN